MGVAITPDGEHAYITNWGTTEWIGAVSVISLNANTILPTVSPDTSEFPFLIIVVVSTTLSIVIICIAIFAKKRMRVKKRLLRGSTSTLLFLIFIN